MASSSSRPVKAIKKLIMNKQSHVTAFSSTAIALYGYDQGMMSLINTNFSYLDTMGITEEDPLVAVIVSIYYIGCAIGAILASRFADKSGRKPSMLTSLLTASAGNLLMFLAGLGYSRGAIWVMLAGRFIMGLGVGGIDSVVPVYSSELHDSDERGRALAQEFQANILGLNIAFGLNLFVTRHLGKSNQWAWRIPIIAMQVFPVILLSFIFRLPESPRWFVFKEKDEKAKKALNTIYDQKDAEEELKTLKKARDDASDEKIGYSDMLSPKGSQFHPTMLTIMGQINQALTGYGCISVYGPQVFQLLGFNTVDAEFITLGNYLFYLLMMTVAWMTIDVLGRRKLMLAGSIVLVFSFLLLTVFGGVVSEPSIHVPKLPFSITGAVILYIATSAFGIGWLPQPWLIPTEIFPSDARAQGAAISVVVWGMANFAVTFLSPILFNNLDYWIFLIFAGTNIFAGTWTWLYSPETGGRSFEENVRFFEDAAEHETWRVHFVNESEFTSMPKEKGEEEGAESQPLLGSGN